MKVKRKDKLGVEEKVGVKRRKEKSGAEDGGIRCTRGLTFSLYTKWKKLQAKSNHLEETPANICCHKERQSSSTVDVK